MTTYEMSSAYTLDPICKISDDGTVLSTENEAVTDAFLLEVEEMGFEGAMDHWSRSMHFEPVGDVSKEAELTADGAICKADEEQQNLFGWAYVAIDKEGQVLVDKSGDFIDSVEELEKSAYGFVTTSRNGDLDHTNLKSATMIESMVFTPEKIEKMGIPAGSIPEGAWWIGFHFDDPADWAEAKKRKSFSIHGSGSRTRVEPQNSSE